MEQGDVRAVDDDPAFGGLRAFLSGDRRHRRGPAGGEECGSAGHRRGLYPVLPQYAALRAAAVFSTSRSGSSRRPIPRTAGWKFQSSAMWAGRSFRSLSLPGPLTSRSSAPGSRPCPSRPRRPPKRLAIRACRSTATSSFPWRCGCRSRRSTTTWSIWSRPRPRPSSSRCRSCSISR